MTRSSFVNRWPFVLALVAGAGGACSNSTEGDTGSTLGDPDTAAIVNQLQAELDAGATQNAVAANNASPVKPVLKCVEKTGTNSYKAHFGYSNSSSSNITIPIGFYNRFWPAPINRGQPTVFTPGLHADVVQVPFSGYSAVVWILGTKVDLDLSIATKYSKACPTNNGTGGAGTGGKGTGGANTGGAGTGGRGTGGANTGGAAGRGTGGANTGGAAGRGTGGTNTGGTNTGGANTGGANTGGTNTGGANTGGANTGGANTGGSQGTGGAPVCTPPSTCDDANPCTVDQVGTVVDPATGLCQCRHFAGNDGATCSDGNACTTGDKCLAGVCGGVAKTCTASDQCHVAGTCDVATGACTNPTKADQSPCTDGNACTTGDFCLSGVCTMGTPTICAAADQCHGVGVCDTATGACSNPTAPAGTTCNDNNSCTLADVCTNGVCGGTPKTCVASDQCHAAGICDSASGTCTNPAVSNGTACNDGNACTTVDSCQAGSCVGGSPKTCTASDQCHAAGVCDSATGTCSNPAAADGTACNDSNACTTGESCQSGSCSGGVVKTCTASGVCHVAGVCQPATGTCTDPAAPDGTTCNDNNVCSSGDMCSAGLCVATATIAPTHCPNCPAGSSTCSGSACDACTFGDAGNCNPDTDGCDFFAGNPADQALCEQVYKCFNDPANNCVHGGDPLSCWCGTNAGTCTTSNTGTTKANGPCLDLVLQGSKLPAYDAATLFQYFTDTTTPLGRATNITLCRGSYCSLECGVK